MKPTLKKTLKVIESIKTEMAVMPPVGFDKSGRPIVRPKNRLAGLKESVNSHAYKLTPATPEELERWGVPPGSIKYKYTGPGSGDRGLNWGPPTFIVRNGDQWSDWFDGEGTYTAGSPEAVADCLAADDWLMLFGDDPAGQQNEASPMIIPAN